MDISLPFSNGVFLWDDVNDSGAGWPPNTSFSPEPR